MKNILYANQKNTAWRIDCSNSVSFTGPRLPKDNQQTNPVMEPNQKKSFMVNKNNEGQLNTFRIFKKLLHFGTLKV